tara:strand:+ start:160 stop:1062 length:903 start_codon:yes stop_codon:yes gene_type:complete
MSKPFILHMITTAKNLSPFDVNMAYDAGWDKCVPYTDIQEEEVEGIVQDAIFSRPPGLNQTGIFIGGRDPHKAIDMLEICKKSLVPPFTISGFADPSGAFTTAAGMIAKVESALRETFQENLANKKILILGGTGPVGITAGILAAASGSNVWILGRKKEKCDDVVSFCKKKYLNNIKGTVNGAANDELDELIIDTDIILASAAAGIQLVSEEQINKSEKLKIAADVNAVPPSGIYGMDAMQNGTPISKSSDAIGIGALAIGNVKYQTQNQLLKRMTEAKEPVFFDFHNALESAREYASKK